MRRNFIENIGFEFIKERSSLILQFLSVTKPGQELTNKQIAELIKATSRYLEKVTIQKELGHTFEKFSYIESNEPSNDRPFYKFISQETYDRYISKGSFQLGSLKYYQKIEQNESRDEKEGFSNVIIDSDDRQILGSVISGFDNWILCGSKDLEQLDYMKTKFGGVIMKVDDMKKFADQLTNSIGATSWNINEIVYSDFKAIRKRIDGIDLTGVNPNNLSDEFFEVLIELTELPSLFSKPTRFKPENELRLTFKVENPVDGALNFQNHELLSFIEILE